MCMCHNYINLCNMDTLGPTKSVLIIKVSSVWIIQGPHFQVFILIKVMVMCLILNIIFDGQCHGQCQ